MIDLAKTPIFGDSFKAGAARFREELGLNVAPTDAAKFASPGGGANPGAFDPDAARTALASVNNSRVVNIKGPINSPATAHAVVEAALEGQAASAGGADADRIMAR